MSRYTSENLALLSQSLTLLLDGMGKFADKAATGKPRDIARMISKENEVSFCLITRVIGHSI